MGKINVLLADDHELFREGLATIINAQPDFEIIGEASDGLEAFIQAQELRPDLILMDVCMPGCDGVEATQRIKEILPETTIVMLTVCDEDEQLFEAIRNGAQGYLLKNIRSSKLLTLLRGAVHGQAALPLTLASRILDEFRRLETQPSEWEDDVPSLTPREQEVLCLVARGHTDQEIADALTISIHTVKTHMRNILAKLNLDHRHEAAQFAMRNGLINAPLRHAYLNPQL
jgi:DNA-binding NarL/FixJ family response regulator